MFDRSSLSLAWSLLGHTPEEFEARLIDTSVDRCAAEAVRPPGARRGIVFDVGHGGSSFANSVALIALKGKWKRFLA